jgi:hypothetical protein
MKITIEEVPSKLKNDVVRIGGECNYYQELDECFIAIFHHHELATEGDAVVITDELTGYELIIDRTDFFTIQLI